ncbi:hypothetical protein GJ496_005459 [Pomphorhynchus laevis]|nr:hypothetical protein GJ496_005459 [Pomphorhynchus laevis]
MYGYNLHTVYPQLNDNETGAVENSFPSHYQPDVQLLQDHIEDLERRIESQQNELIVRASALDSQQLGIDELQEIINKERTEKRRMEEQISRYKGDLFAEENKINLIKSGRVKIEQELQEAQEQITTEKALRNDLEKAKRKLEMDVRTCQSDYNDLLQHKYKLENMLSTKDEQIAKLQSLETATNSERNKCVRKLEDLKNDLENKCEELERENELRVKAERIRSTLESEISELDSALQEVRQSSSLNIDNIRRRDIELEKLRNDIQNLDKRSSENISQLKRKHETAVDEMCRQIEYLKQEKTKAVKEVEIYKSETIFVNEELEKVTKEKDKNKILNSQLEERVEDYRRQVQEMTAKIDEIVCEKKKSDQDVKCLSRMLDENSTLISTLTKAKEQLQSHLEHARHEIDEESRSRIALAAELRTVGTELDSTKCQLEDELENKAELERDVIKLSNSLDQCKKRYESERFEHIREIENIRSKMEMQCGQLEDQLEQSASRVTSLERMKEKLQSEIEELMGELDRANVNAMQQERKTKRFDKLIEEWKQKCENTSSELAAAQNKEKYLTTEIYKSNEQYEEAQEQIESLRRENRNLSEEIKSLMTQISDNARNALDFEVERKRIEKEKEELRLNVDDALSAKDEAESKVRRLEADKSALELEHIAALKEQEEDLLSAKRQIERQLDGLQLCLDSERMAKREILAQRDHLQSEITEMTVELEHKMDEIKDLNIMLEQDREKFEEYERQLKEEVLIANMAREAEISANRKCRTLQAEIDDHKTAANTLLKQIENLAADFNRCKHENQELNNQNNTLNSRISHVETLRLNADLNLEEKKCDLRVLEEKYSKITLDLSRVGEKLRIEEDHSNELELKVSNLEVMLSEATDRAETAKTDAMKSCKTTIQSLEDQLQQKHGDFALMGMTCEDQRRQLSKCERRIKDIQNQLQISNEHNDKLMQHNEGLQTKIKLTRKQADQAEEEAAQCMARFKAMSEDVEKAETRADRAEKMINKYRAASRFGIATGTPLNTEPIDAIATIESQVPRGQQLASTKDDDISTNFDSIIKLLHQSQKQLNEERCKRHKCEKALRDLYISYLNKHASKHTDSDDRIYQKRKEYQQGRRESSSEMSTACMRICSHI